MRNKEEIEHPRPVRHQPIAGAKTEHHLSRSGQAKKKLPGLHQVRWDLVIVAEAHRMSWPPGPQDGPGRVG